MSAPEVVCIGLATADTIVSLAGWPGPDGRVEADAIARGGGGPAATAAVALAHLGHRVAIVGAVGDDAVGAEVRRGLVEAGVDTAALRTLPGRSAESVIVLDRVAATRTILHAPGTTLPGLDERAAAMCRAARWVHVDHAGYRLGGDLDLDRGRLSVDAGHPIADLAVRGLGLYAPAERALLDRFGASTAHAAVDTALGAGAQRVAVTLGERGAIAADASGAWHVAAPSVEVLSTLGAGDVFHGALLAALLENRALHDALRRATVAATLSCRALDGRGAIPDRRELEAALADAPQTERLTAAPRS